MDNYFSPKKFALLLGAAIAPASASAEVYFEATGKLAVEVRSFSEDAAFANQHQQTNLSLAAEPELFWEWNDGADSLTFKPFYRLDQHDDERSHGDIRELSYIHASDNWELRAGIRKEFWGVTEFQHLMDVINQSDGVEDLDNEDKLGQAMINLSLVNDWGIVDAYLLPGFRERTFPGSKGRLRSGFVVDTSNAQYQSGAEDKHVDLALRWSHTLGDYDIGAYVFNGTNRDPILRPSTQGGQTVLTPYYEQMTQFGFDAQATLDSWLWKAEAIYRDTDSDNYWASQAGFEYTFYGLAQGSSDLGVLLEYGWDERGTEGDSIMQNDLAFGARWALNDEASSELLGGVIYDLDHRDYNFSLEASRRIGDDWKVNLDARIFQADEAANPVTALDRDDHIQLTLERYF